MRAQDEERIEEIELEIARLRKALGTLITWLGRELGEMSQIDLLDILNGTETRAEKKS